MNEGSEDTGVGKHVCVCVRERERERQRRQRESERKRERKKSREEIPYTKREYDDAIGVDTH